MSLAPASRAARLVERTSALVARGSTRRGFLQRSALVGSALAVSPLQYLLRPGTAYAAICNCSGQPCGCGSRCCDGYTEFCCTITGENSCPPGTLVAGWWKADGSGFCDVNGVSQPRYYMDCNASCNGCGCGSSGICSQECTSCACGCANGSCGNRKSCCTSFRYGQCNQHVACVGQIVCRVVTCQPPWELDASCTTAVLTDNNTRFHDAPCLHPPPPLHPDGAILKTAASPVVWVIDRGERWPVVHEDAYASRAGWGEVITVAPSALERFPVAATGFRDGEVLRTPDGRVWVVSGGARRHVANESVFHGLGLKEAAVRQVSDFEAAANPLGTPLTTATVPPDGLFVQRNGAGPVFRVVDGQLRAVRTPSILDSYRVTPEEVASITDAQAARLTPGAPLGFRDGTLVQGPDGRVFAISEGARRWVSSPQVFAALGYNAAAVRSVSADELALHPEGEAVDEPVHPEGALVRASGHPTVWVVRDGIRQPFATEAAFVSFASFDEVAVAPGDVLAPHPTLALGWRDGSVLRVPDGRVFLISDGRRRHITSEAAFRSLGYSHASLRHVPLHGAAVHPPGEPITTGATVVDGMFVQVRTGSPVYRIVDGQARAVVSLAALASWHVRSEEVAQIAAAQLPPEGELLGFRDGTLIQTPDGRVFAIAEGLRRWISTGEAFSALGYDPADIVHVADEEASVHPEGPPIG